MDKQNQKVLTHEDCKQMSLEELEKHDFSGYKMPFKYQKRVREFRETYNIVTPQEANEDYQMGILKGQYVREKMKAHKEAQETRANNDNSSITQENKNRVVRANEAQSKVETAESSGKKVIKHSSEAFYKSVQKESGVNERSRDAQEDASLPDFNFKKKFNEAKLKMEEMEKKQNK